MINNNAQLFSQRIIICKDCPAITIAAQIF